MQILKKVSSKVSIRTCTVEALNRVTAISQHDDFSHALIAAPKEKMSCGALPRQRLRALRAHLTATALPIDNA